MVEAAGRVMAEEHIGPYLRRARVAAGFDTADEVMRASGNRISAHGIRGIERGNVDRPRPETLEVLAELYRVPYDDLMRRAGYFPDPPAAEEVDEAGEFMALFRGLSAEDRSFALAFVRRLLAGRHPAGNGAGSVDN
jgi:transcriptional regulator with XRE-family HTH domain